MYYKKFHDLSLSALGFGALRLPLEGEGGGRIHRAEARKVLDCALDLGINYIDTAYTYNDGDSERFLGEALAGRPRDSYCLATKFYAVSGKPVEEVFEEQLRRCRTDYFDVYMLHGLDENYISDYMDEGKDYIGYLQRQKEAGRIRCIGFSSHANPRTLERFLSWNDRFDMALIQLNYLDWTMLDARGQYELLTRRGIPVWVMEPLKGGRLSQLSPEAAAILKEAAPERSLSSWGFRFLMGLPNVKVVLSGMSTTEQVTENAETFRREDPLNEKEQAALRRAASVFMEQMGVPCSSCRYCCSACPAGLDIPLLIKGYNEYRVSGETWRVVDYERRERGAEACLRCGACLKRCPQKIDIPGTMARLAALEAEQACPQEQKGV